MKILSIETSADETAAAVTEERRVLSNVIYSQILTHKKWGGIYPSLAKRAHEERIDEILKNAMKNFSYEEIDAIAVTYGPGLAIAIEVGIRKAKEIAKKYNKPLIAVNHLEGHIYSSFVQNSQGNPKNKYLFPYLAYVISGGHTELVLMKDHLTYEILGETRDDAAGEALDKAAKMLGLGYPGGPAIERLALENNNTDIYKFPRPMTKEQTLEFSFSGLKTSFYYFLKKNEPLINTGLRDLASSFQEAVFDTLVKKLELAIKKTGINRVVVGGGVSANMHLRKKFRKLLEKYKGQVLFPPYKYLTGDNAVMIGVVAYYKAKKDLYVKDIEKLDRKPRLSLQD
ncbi:MAG: putative tRNA threonylcarbamoyladenosine biosynthesis protein Gcp [Candidatus Roizmanbacteria bacterium GW2011_GWA2_36_23]|uniref:tRNA N6-adenosine threonylcarbamoyltransferase n=1 Tax=Candidatus Roizmanbacteria bacterium GW2011_GWA2_36_23 TaxID=1618480 RepID=A0A0G0EL71_9BACT|nr:MAG: putative tRNA threonylcarbamoyladenosine biosynthesis protein Gcp [Candidatus Roizmanbacteria bacterium GW2011_GWA2_36_23]